MKRLIIFAVIVLGLVPDPDASGQNNPVTTRLVYNSGTTTLFIYHAVKKDTASKVIAFDTTGSLGVNTTWVTYKSDTTGDAAGTYNIALFPDTAAKWTDLFRFRVRPVTTPSTDTFVVYGDTINDKNLLIPSYTGKKIDTLVWASTINEQWSHAFWVSWDSVKIKTGGAGSDSFRVLYQSPRWVVIADSVTDMYAGLVYRDTIATQSSGYIIQQGPYKAYVSGAGRSVESGEILTTSINGKLVALDAQKTERTPTIYADTVRTTGGSSRRYLKGAAKWNPINVTPIRIYTGAAYDTLQHAGFTTTDSFYVIISSINDPAVAIPAATRDSVSVSVFFNTARTDISTERKAGWALQFTRTDSTLIDVYVNALK